MSAKAVSAVLFCFLIVGAVAQAAEDWISPSVRYGGPVRGSLEKDLGEPPPLGLPLLTVGDCSDYIDLTGQPLPIEVAGTTVGAANNYGPFPIWPSCWQGEWWDPLSANGPDITFKWTVPTTGRYTISLCGSAYDTGLLLYEFTCPTEPVYPRDFICGNEDACGRQSELLARPFREGDEILIVVDGYGYQAGAYQLTISWYEPTADLNAFIIETMESEHVPGVAACAIYDGDIVWTGSYGLADIEHSVPVADTTLFVLASISKTVTGIALMQLWEDGRFALDDDINDYLPFQVNHPNPGCADSAITFRMLLSHTSSIKDNWGGVLNSLWTWGEDSPIPLREFLEGYLTPGGIYYSPSGNFDYSSCPGERWRYSNVGATLAGYLAEAIADTSFATYCQDSLFAPLSMDETSWFLANLDTTHVAVPYRWTGSGYRRFPHSHSPIYPSIHLRSSTLQLARHLTAFMQCGVIDTVRVLDCPTVNLMTTYQYPDLMFGHGLIWYTVPLGGRWLWGHSGSTLGCRTQMRYCPEEYSGAIVLTNGESAYARELIMHEIFEYVRETTSVPGVSDHSPILEIVSLDQNRPNPFNPTTVLSYSLSRPDRVTLAIYNMLGRRVATLCDGLQEAGQHRVTWDATGISSGLYFARIASQGEVKTIKLVLAR